MAVYNPNDVFIVQRNSTSSSFVEKVLSSSPNTIFFFDSSSNVMALPTLSMNVGKSINSDTASILKIGNLKDTPILSGLVY